MRNPPQDVLDPDAMFYPFPLFFRTNYVAQGTDVPVLQRTISKAKEELSRLDAQASWVVSRRNTIEMYLKECQGMMNPMRRIPDDVLRELMIHCVASNWMDQLQSPAWALSQICRHWKNIALSTPQIWTYISVNLDANTKEDGGSVRDTMLHIIKQMITFSKGRPLSVELTLHDQNSISRDISNVIFSQSKRIAFLRILANKYLHHISLPAASFPVLRSLEVCNIGIIAPMLLKCQKLTNIRLSEAGVNLASYQKLELPWTQLVSMAIQHNQGELSQLFSLLKQTLALEELVISIGDKVIAPTASTKDFISLLELKRLYLRVCGSQCGRGLLQALFLPSLQDLTLDTRFENEDAPSGQRFYDQLISLIKLSRCNISRFSLIDDGWATLDALLKTMPNLEYFKYFISPDSDIPVSQVPPYDADSLLEIFVSSPKSDEGDKAFGRLKEFDLSGRPLGGSKTSLVNFLRQQGPALKTFRLHISDSPVVFDPLEFVEIAMKLKLGSRCLDIDMKTNMKTLFQRKKLSRQDHRMIPNLLVNEHFNWMKVDGCW